MAGYRYLGQGPPTAAEVEVARAQSYVMLFAFATRAAAVFMIATATIGIKSGTFPRWFTWTGYLLGLAMLAGGRLLGLGDPRAARVGRRGEPVHPAPRAPADPGGAVVTWGIVFRLRQYIKSSLWLAPLAGGLLGLALAEAGALLEARQPLPTAWHYSPETATAVLSATIGAVASLTGFVVTVTVLGVQMATGTFSPRYMRMWYRDPMLKALLAVLIGTLMFSFSVIRRISADSVPDLSVTLAGIGVAIGLLLFVLYLDRFIHRMRPVAVAALDGGRGPACLRGLARGGVAAGHGLRPQGL